MKKKIAVLPGDGVGKEVIAEAIKVLNTIASLYDHSFVYDYGLIGAAAMDETGDPFPKETENLCRKSHAVLFGAIGDPKYDRDLSAKVRPEQGLLRMRASLGLYANMRPIKSYEPIYDNSPLKNDRVKGVDFVVFRELTSGIYFGKPRGRAEDGSEAYDTCIYTREEILRVSEMAFQAAQKRKGKITVVDKANIMATSRLWREVVKELNKEYADVKVEFMFVDNAAMNIITNPSQFDVILTENLFGDILTDEASVIAGSLGLLPSASFGEESKLFEPIHGAYPQMAGKNRANPIAAILSAALMLEHALNAPMEADLIREAVLASMEKGIVTEDINPKKNSSTREVGDFVSEYLTSRYIDDPNPMTII
ncbi:MAG: 3-isopropylmalate dehydrogenase [Cyclobacteriaceae bacterium]|nr:3-isopropylmalate dehydrogenase [Cyclobacteriaceae bacterium]